MSWCTSERERFMVHIKCVNQLTHCFRCCSSRRRRSSSTPSLGRLRSPVALSSSKGCCVRWSRTRWSCTHLSATLPKATPKALVRCKLGPVHVGTSNGRLQLEKVRLRLVIGRWFAIAVEDNAEDDGEQHDIDDDELTMAGDRGSEDGRE